MVPVILIILSVIGIIIINLLNKDRPAYRLGGTITIILGCALGMLYYYNICMFRETRTIILTVALSVALLILAYILVILLGSYNRGKNEARKNNISKRPTFKSGAKKEKRQKAYNRITEHEAEQAETVATDKSNKREKRLLIQPDNGVYRTVGDYLNQIEEETNEKGNELSEDHLKNKTQKVQDDLNEEIEGAEDWIPVSISDDELREYMKAQYAWMEEDRPEDQLSLSVVFGDDDDEKADAELSIEQVPDEEYLNVGDSQTQSAYITESVQENTDAIRIIQKSTVVEYEEETPQTAQEQYAEEIPISRDSEIEYIDIDKHKGLVPLEVESNSIFIDIEDNTEPVIPIEADMDWDETDITEPYYVDADVQNRSKERFGGYEEPGYAYTEEDDVLINTSSIAGTDEYIENQGQASVYDGLITEQENVEAGYDYEYDVPIDNVTVYDIDNNMTEEKIEEVIEQEITLEYEPETIHAPEISAGEDMPVPVVLSDDEAEYNEGVLIEPEPVTEAPVVAFTTPEELPVQKTQPYDIELTPEDEKRIASEQKKQREMDELTELVKAKSYNDAMKKLFEILNAGYVMTPDEKQKMRIIMLTLKAKT